MLKYELGEMKNGDGTLLRFEVEKKASFYADSISELLARRPVYKELIRKLPSPRVIKYIKHAVREEIYPFIRQGCVMQYYIRNNKPLDSKYRIVYVPRDGILTALKEVWDFEGIQIKLVNLFSITALRNALCRNRMLTLLGTRLSEYFSPSAKFLLSMLQNRKSSKGFKKPDNFLVACSLVEGLDSSRRNDLNWQAGSGIDSDEIIFYFDSIHRLPLYNDMVDSGKIIIVDCVQKLSLSWKALAKHIKAKLSFISWNPPQLSRSTLINTGPRQNGIDKWLTKEANSFLRHVHYWTSFYKSFNIGINYTPAEGYLGNIAQAAAFDVNKDRPGFFMGKQRSEIFLPIHDYYMGHQPKDIFFIWNKRSASYLMREDIDYCIITGYPYDIKSVASNANYAARLRLRGAKFIIALFDNAYGPDIHFSQKTVENFYRPFLRWIIEDPGIGLIVKSKKPQVLESLHSLCSMLKRSLATNRCVLIDEKRVLATEAAAGSDISVGLGISSAVTEAVIVGCKGVHYDSLGLRNHEFYKSGYKRVIFDDLDTLVKSLGRYVTDRRLEPALGDWSGIMDYVDPYCDGRGGERMGLYMRWLIDYLNEGKNRREAVESANGRYANMWGRDKIVNMKGGGQVD